MTSRILLSTGTVLSAALLLSACGGGGDSTPETVTETATTTAPAATGESSTPGTATTSATTSASEGNTAEDPVFAAIDAVLAQHAGGIIVDIDREDQRETYDIDVVVDGQVLELEVDGDGTIREDEREGDEDDVREAQEATLTAAEAIRQALDQHPEGVLDEAQLDEDDGDLSWEISLDDAQRDDLAEVNIPAR